MSFGVTDAAFAAAAAAAPRDSTARGAKLGVSFTFSVSLYYIDNLILYWSATAAIFTDGACNSHTCCGSAQQLALHILHRKLIRVVCYCTVAQPDMFCSLLL
jgi:hypothetical protein